MVDYNIFNHGISKQEGLLKSPRLHSLD